ncbi:hypothetical protein DRO34_00410 [Candidatus Bathyarchaeota archaeon]|nr:MAG: hypothetical protein DRO34_00410 [Candidatus Bathyarchaeota archaeon]RLI30064.1 MAG: hypothetical protein DRO50_00285 [Candidatus Bathyarchaeota archaeon]
MTLETYVARIEETCGAEKDFVVVLKYEKKDEAINKILRKVKLIRSVANIIYDLEFQKATLRLYKNGKIIIKNVKNRKDVEAKLTSLLS